jgi:DNA-binding transcriptional ArsR family regulator
MTQVTESQARFKAKIFHALSAAERVKILEFLRDGEKCVCEIVPHLNQIQPVVSRHLKILKDSGIVTFRKDGTKRMYAIADARIFGVVDAVTPELAKALKKEVLKSV